VNPRTYFARHAQTLVGSLGRIAAQPLASLLTMAVIAVALALPLLLYLMLANARSATGDLAEALDLSVFMTRSAGAGRAAALAKALKQRTDVAAVRIVTAEQALADFRKESGFGQALDALPDNPLPDTLIVTPSIAAGTPDGMQRLQTAIAAMTDVQTVQVDTQWVRRLQALLELARRIVTLIGGLLGVAVVLIVSNTIRLDILNRRTEIEVMKLVGATDGFARRPFLYAGLWYGLGGGILALLLAMIGTASLMQPVARLAVLYGSGYRLHGLSAADAGCVLLLAAGLSWLGSWFAATRHIRAVDPA
jgi:cell division transport system permease protein